MDEYTKTKVGFTIALLATTFAINPIIETYKHVGFIIFNSNITIKTAFLISISSLGIAVYLISLQFISRRYIFLLDKTSQLAYSLSLATPIIFCILCLITIISAWISSITDIITEEVWNSLAAAIAATLGSLLTSIISLSIKTKDSDLRKEDASNKEFELLSRVEHLIEEGHYDLSLLESFKIIEFALKQRITSTPLNRHSSFIHIIKAPEIQTLLTTEVLEKLNELRFLRNNSIHSELEISKEDAVMAMHTAKRIVKILSTLTGIRGFDWLCVNYKEAIEALSKKDSSLTNEIIDHLWDAWINRDGAIYREISEFFEIALKTTPDLIIKMFSKNEKELNSWLNQIDSQLFTDYAGLGKDSLKKLKNDILLSLDTYISSIENNEYKLIACKIKDACQQAPIREID